MIMKQIVKQKFDRGREEQRRRGRVSRKKERKKEVYSQWNRIKGVRSKVYRDWRYIEERVKEVVGN